MGNDARLTLKQSRFVNFWFKTGGNATEAARLAGYSGDTNALAVRGSENVRKSNIHNQITKKLESESMSVDEALWRLTQIGRMDISPYVEGYGRLPWLDLQQLIDDGYGHLIKSIKQTKDGTNIEFYDKQKALDQIIRYYKIDAPGVQVNVNQQVMMLWADDRDNTT